MQDNRKSWEVKDEAIVRELHELVALSAEERAQLEALQPAARQAAPQLAEDISNRLVSHELSREFIDDPAKLRAALEAWFVGLFDGRYDEVHARQRLGAGDLPARIGMPVRYPLAMLDLISGHGEQVAATAGGAAVQAFRKVLAIDLATLGQACENNRLCLVAEVTGSERLARRLLSGN